MRAIASRHEGEAMSRTAATRIRVEWGDCDPAGIVYYPNFFHWCDVATWNFFAASGLPLIELQKRYGIVGFPLLEASATFRVPSRPQDLLTIATSLGTLRRKTLELRHPFSPDAAPLLEPPPTRIRPHPPPTPP